MVIGKLTPLAGSNSLTWKQGKAQIRALKVDRDAAMQAKDKKKLKPILRKIHRLKRAIHKATV